MWEFWVKTMGVAVAKLRGFAKASPITDYSRAATGWGYARQEDNESTSQRVGAVTGKVWFEI